MLHKGFYGIASLRFTHGRISHFAIGFTYLMIRADSFESKLSLSKLSSKIGTVIGTLLLRHLATIYQLLGINVLFDVITYSTLIKLPACGLLEHLVHNMYCFVKIHCLNLNWTMKTSDSSSYLSADY